jgi:hypothetical protein
LARVASAATAASKTRIASISGKGHGSFLSSAKELHGLLGEPLELGEKLSNLTARNVSSSCSTPLIDCWILVSGMFLIL